MDGYEKQIKEYDQRIDNLARELRTLREHAKTEVKA